MRHTMRILLSSLAMASVLATDIRAEVRLPNVFGDHMVMQQDRPIRVWGWAEAGEKVTVEFAGTHQSTKAAADGTWRIDLPAMQADGKMHSLQVTGTNTITFNDVVLGEVWICSGQSNMEWPLARTRDAEQEIATAEDAQLRLFDVQGHIACPEPKDDLPGKWQVCSPETVRGFSAVGYFFGRELREHLDVPIGLVGTNWGGTPIERWTPPTGFRQVPALEDFAKSFEPESAGRQPGNSTDREPAKPLRNAAAIYNGMVHPLVPLSVRGTIWYQGESNAGDGRRYEFMTEGLVQGWRTVFENDVMSFYWVQLANFQTASNDPAGPPGGGWGPVREGQRRALRLPNTGMAVTIDIGEANDIHPRNKQDVGKRLSLWALAKTYGKDLVCSGPLYREITREGNKIRISFDHVGGGLMVGKKEGLAPTTETPDAEPQRFAIQDSAGKWHWAKAAIDGPTVLVWSDDVEEPRNVRFGFETNPAGINLYNKEGLPASPFTTEP